MAQLHGTFGQAIHFSDETWHHTQRECSTVVERNPDEAKSGSNGLPECEECERIAQRNGGRTMRLADRTFM